MIISNANPCNYDLVYFQITNNTSNHYRYSNINIMGENEFQELICLATFYKILSGTEEGEYIRYTLDSTEPDYTSNLYSNPININSTTIVRAKIFKNNYISGYSNSRSYLFNIKVYHLFPLSQILIIYLIMIMEFMNLEMMQMVDFLILAQIF